MTLSRKTIAAVFCVYFVIAAVTIQHINKSKDAAKTLEKLEKRRADSDPVSISIPRIKLNKEVKLGIYNFGQDTWNITSNYPHFAVLSARPNETSGNTIIYAHNTKNLFGDIDHLKSQDRVMIRTKNGKVFVYAYESKEDVKPSDMSVFSRYEKPYLTLITCTGRNNELRRLFYFKLLQAV